MATGRGSSRSKRGGAKSAPRSSKRNRSRTTNRTSSRGKSSGTRPGGGAENRAFRRAKKAGEEALKDPKKARSLAAKARTKFAKNWDRLGDAVDELDALIRMIQAYAKGDYRDVPWTTLVSAAGAVVYFVMPLDLIPDPLVPAGYVDDITVILFVVAAIQHDLDAFERWEDKKGDGSSGAGASRKKTKPKRPSPSGKTRKKTSPTP